jgi:hypothetical protein
MIKMLQEVITQMLPTMPVFAHTTVGAQFIVQCLSLRQDGRRCIGLHLGK